MAADPATLEQWDTHMAAGYPTRQLTLKFVKWLLSTRKRKSLASRREGHELQGRHASSVKQSFTHMRNHVWPTLYTQAGFPTDPAFTSGRRYCSSHRSHAGGITFTTSPQSWARLSASPLGYLSECVACTRAVDNG